MMDVKRSLDITQGTTMTEPAAALSRPQSEVGQVVDFDPEKPYPTEEEFATLPRVPGSIPWTAWTVAIVEFAERFSYYGTTAVCKDLEAMMPLKHPPTNMSQSSISFRSRFLRDPIPALVSSSPLGPGLWEWDNVHLLDSPPVRSWDIEYSSACTY